MSKFDEMMDKGGIGFWFVCIICSIGFYGFLWLAMALGISFDL